MEKHCATRFCTTQIKPVNQLAITSLVKNTDADKFHKMFEFDISKHPPLLALGRALQASGSVRYEWGGQREGGGGMLCCGPIPFTATPNVRSSITPLRQHFSRSH